MDNYRKKLLYRSMHRGCKETDIILGNFAAQHIKSLSSEELEMYEKIVECDDHVLYGCITGTVAVPENLDIQLLKRIARRG